MMRGCTLNDYTPSSQIQEKLEETSSRKQTGFKQLDLTIAYRALIQSFVQSDEIPISEGEAKKQDEKVCGNS